MKQEITMIAAVGRDGAIGRGGDLIWHIREDMRRFRSLTMGCPVIMGRKTFESLPAALKGRRNIVVTGDSAYTAPGIETATSPDAALALCADAPRVIIIGGGKIYAAMQPRATSLEITKVDADTPDADTYFFHISKKSWEIAEQSETHTDRTLGLSYTYLRYTRRKK